MSVQHCMTKGFVQTELHAQEHKGYVRLWLQDETGKGSAEPVVMDASGCRALADTLRGYAEELETDAALVGDD